MRAATKPSSPGRFSTVMGRPQRALNFAASRRAAISAPEPRPSGKMNLTVRCGQFRSAAVPESGPVMTALSAFNMRMTTSPTAFAHAGMQHIKLTTVSHRGAGNCPTFTSRMLAATAPFVLLDYLVGAGEQRWRHVEAERLRSFQVDHQ